jgi:hypothetical protein
MQEVLIPTVEEIRAMARARCQSERIRLKNEISFARVMRCGAGPQVKKKSLRLRLRSMRSIAA